MTGLEKLKSFNHMYRQERGSIGTNYIDAVDDLIFEVERLRQRVAEQDKVVESEGVDRSAVSQRQANDIKLKDESIRRKNQRIRELVQKATEKNAQIVDLENALRKLSFFAQTSGSVSGRDELLCASIENAERVLAEIEESRMGKE